MAKSKWEFVKGRLDAISAWCRMGMLEKDIAKKLKISVSTLESYKLSHPELLEALKNGKEDADDNVENALYEKCIGKFIYEEQAFKCKNVFYDESGRRCESEDIVVQEVKKYIPSETMAQLAWLNNRRPQRWRKNANKEKLDEQRFDHDKENDSKKYW